MSKLSNTRQQQTSDSQTENLFQHLHILHVSIPSNVSSVIATCLPPRSLSHRQNIMLTRHMEFCKIQMSISVCPKLFLLFIHNIKLKLFSGLLCWSLSPPAVSRLWYCSHFCKLCWGLFTSHPRHPSSHNQSEHSRGPVLTPTSSMAVLEVEQGERTEEEERNPSNNRVKDCKHGLAMMVAYITYVSGLKLWHKVNFCISQAIGITSATCLGIHLVLEIINVISGLHPDDDEYYYTKYDQVLIFLEYDVEEKKSHKLMGIMLLLTAYIIIFWIWPSHVLLTGIRTDCYKKFIPWILSMLFQSLILFFYIYLQGGQLLWLVFVFGWFGCFGLLAVILILQVSQILVWTVFFGDIYRWVECI